jgi:hypothetical protein
MTDKLTHLQQRRQVVSYDVEDITDALQSISDELNVGDAYWLKEANEQIQAQEMLIAELFDYILELEGE